MVLFSWFVRIDVLLKLGLVHDSQLVTEPKPVVLERMQGNERERAL